MTKEFKSCNKQRMEQFIKLLRSRRYSQTSFMLQRYNPYGENGFCCLGVAVKLYEQLECKTVFKQFTEIGSYRVETLNGEQEVGLLPTEVTIWMGISNNPNLDIPESVKKVLPCSGFQRNAVELNDIYNIPFSLIADCFEHTYLRDLDQKEDSEIDNNDNSNPKATGTDRSDSTCDPENDTGSSS